MYAVISTGGKQYKVSEGQTIRVEKLPGDVGTAVSFDQVLICSDGDTVRVGQPTLPDVTVTGQIAQQGKAKKILVFKFKRRKGYRKKRGHRQHFTAIRINAIEGNE